MTLEDFIFKTNQVFSLQVGCSTIQGQVVKVKKNIVTFKLSKLVPIYDGIKVLVSKKIDKMIDLIGVGDINL